MKRSILTLTLLACSALATPAIASVVVGAPGDAGSGNCFPFGCATGTTYQQVYDASNFSAPLAINSLSFYNTQYNSGTQHVNTGNYTISLSTTSKAVNGLDTTVFANNIGADDLTVFSGDLSGQTIVFGGRLDIALTSTFNYNPSGGNLLVNITYGGGSAGGVFLDARNGTFGTISSRAQNFGSAYDSYGLVTGFDVAGSTVPEPASWALMVAGFGLVGSALRRRVALAA